MVLWQDDLPQAPHRGRLHLAVEGAAPAPAAPEPVVHVARPRLRSLRYDAPLTLAVHCSSACDLRARVARHQDVDAQGSLPSAGTAQLRLTPLYEPLAPAKRGPIRIDVLSGPPGAAKAQRTTLRLSLRRIPAPPLPRILGLTAVRHGAVIDVRWRTDRPAGKNVSFLVAAQTSRGREPLAYHLLRGRGRTQFRVVLRHATRARTVLIGEERALGGSRTTSVRVR